jgi:hypothetical protein
MRPLLSFADSDATPVKEGDGSSVARLKHEPGFKQRPLGFVPHLDAPSNVLAFGDGESVVMR